MSACRWSSLCLFIENVTITGYTHTKKISRTVLTSGGIFVTSEMALPSTMKWNTVQSLSVMTKCSLTDTLSWLFLSLVNTRHTVRQGNGTVLPCGYPCLVFMSLLNTWHTFVHDPKKVLPCRYSEPALSVSGKHTYANTVKHMQWVYNSERKCCDVSAY